MRFTDSGITIRGKNFTFERLVLLYLLFAGVDMNFVTGVEHHGGRRKQLANVQSGMRQTLYIVDSEDSLAVDSVPLQIGLSFLLVWFF